MIGLWNTIQYKISNHCLPTFQAMTYYKKKQSSDDYELLAVQPKSDILFQYFATREKSKKRIQMEQNCFFFFCIAYGGFFFNDFFYIGVWGKEKESLKIWSDQEIWKVVLPHQISREIQNKREQIRIKLREDLKTCHFQVKVANPLCLKKEWLSTSGRNSLFFFDHIKITHTHTPLVSLTRMLSADKSDQALLFPGLPVLWPSSRQQQPEAFTVHTHTYTCTDPHAVQHNSGW